MSRIPKPVTVAYYNRDYDFPVGAKFCVVKVPDPKLKAPNGVAIYGIREAVLAWADDMNKERRWVHGLTFLPEADARNYHTSGYGLVFDTEPEFNEYGEVSP